MKKLNENNNLNNKYHGIFYTPNYIAKYIVDNTIGILIKELLDELNATKNLKQLIIVFNKIKNLKFLDPACGEGIFLLEILKILRDFYQSYNRKFELLLKQNPTEKIGDNFKKIEFPGLFALINNIYGVDENKDAVRETCKELGNELKKEVKIEDSFLMDINIKVGNSLISSLDYNNIKPIKNQLNQILKFRNRYQTFKNLFENDQFLKEEIKKIQNPLDKECNSALKEFFNTENWTFKPFNWVIEFPEVFLLNGGFDAIVGNPPYIRVHKQETEFKNYLRNTYVSPKKDFDIYICFFELSLTILKKNGLLSFIVPDKFLIREYAENLRYLLLNNTSIIELLDISRCNVFKASIYPIIITLKKLEDPLIKLKNMVRFHQNIVNTYQIRGNLKMIWIKSK